MTSPSSVGPLTTAAAPTRRPSRATGQPSGKFRSETPSAIRRLLSLSTNDSVYELQRCTCSATPSTAAPIMRFAAASDETAAIRIPQTRYVAKDPPAASSSRSVRIDISVLSSGSPTILAPIEGYLEDWRQIIGEA